MGGQDCEVPKLERSTTAASAPTTTVADVVVVEVSAPTAILIDLTAPQGPEVDPKAHRDEAEIEAEIAEAKIRFEDDILKIGAKAENPHRVRIKKNYVK